MGANEQLETLIEEIGVDREVADSVMLYSLNCPSAVPVNSRVWRVA